MTQGEHGMKKQQFAVIGMGRFGSSIARALHSMGHTVLAVDTNEQRIQDAAHMVTHAVTADCTDEAALRALDIQSFDVVIVAIGQDIQSSILTTLILKEIGVRMIIAKAQNDLHGKVIKKIGADKVIFPERDMGLRVAHHLMSPNIIDYIEISEDHSIIEMKASAAQIGKSLRQLDIRAKYSCNVMAVKRGGRMNIAPNPDDQLRSNDVLVVVGSNRDLRKFEKAFER